MNAYKIRINVEIVPTTDTPHASPAHCDDGGVEVIIPESEARSIDLCERRLLETSHPVMRDALSRHLSALSKKAMAHGTDAMIRDKAYPYWVDGEVGRFEFTTHCVYAGDRMLSDTASEVFPQRERWEWYKTRGFKEVAYIYGVTEASYRKTSRWLNRLRDQSEREGTPSRSLQAQAEGEGARVLEALDHKATQMLEASHVFTHNGAVSIPDLPLPSQAVTMSQDRVETAIETCQQRLKPPRRCVAILSPTKRKR